MRRQLLRAVMVAAVAGVGAFAVHSAMAQDDTSTGATQNNGAPAQLDRSFDQQQDHGTGGAGTQGMGQPGQVGTTDEQPGMGAGMMDGGMGGTGGAGMDMGMMDGGMGGAGGAGTDVGMMDGGVGNVGGAGSAGTQGEAAEDERARAQDHTNIIVYGPNGVPAPNGQAANQRRTPGTHEQTMGSGGATEEGPAKDQGEATDENVTPGSGPNAEPSGANNR